MSSSSQNSSPPSSFSPPHDVPSSSSDPVDFRRLTRSGTSPRASFLSTEQIFERTSLLEISQRITVKWCLASSPSRSLSSSGFVAKRDGRTILVNYDSHCVQPLPPQSDVRISEIIAHPLRTIPLKPLNLSNWDKTHLPDSWFYVVYCDGGAQGNPGPARSAVVS